MAKILVAYADKRYIESIKRIKRMAKRTKRFDKILIYTDKDLPEYVKASPLFAFSRGGGYWAWKPYVVVDALSKCNLGDIICYVDSGCSLNKDSKEWDDYFSAMENHNALFFQYRENTSYSGWDEFCKNPENNKVEVGYWMKPTTRDYFIEFFGNDDFTHYAKIWCGCFFVKKTKALINIIDEWYRLILFNPLLFVDPIGKERMNLPDSFNAHRHDQTVVTPLVYFYKETDNVLVLPETSESDREHAAIVASRFRQGEMSLWLYIKYRVYNLFYGE